MVPDWQFGLVGILAVALVTDLQTRKIYNWLTFPAMLVGLVLAGVFGGLIGLQSALVGFFAGSIVFAIGFFMGGQMGAGDVKLMAAIGIWLGWPHIVASVLYVTAVGGIIALGSAAVHGSLPKLFKNVYWSLVGMVLPGGKANISPAESAAPPLPYGVSIVIGTLLALFYPEPQDLFDLFRGH